MKKLREMVKRTGRTGAQIAESARIDPSYMSYLNRGGRCSLKVADRIAQALIDVAPELQVDVYLWMLSMGLAPRSLRAAKRELQIAAMACVGLVPAQVEGAAAAEVEGEGAGAVEAAPALEEVAS
jgi:hypothetical protein